MIEFLVAIIVLAVLFEILKMFVPIDARIERIIWLVVAAVVAIWAVKFLVPLIA